MTVQEQLEEKGRKAQEARVKWLQERSLQAARLKGEDAKRYETVAVYEDRPAQPKHRPKAEAWTCRIELFRMENKKPIAHNLLVETSGTDLAEAVASVVERIRKGELTFEKRVGY